MSHHRKATVCCLLILFGAIGCATLFSSGPTVLNFGSDPEAAEVLVNGEAMGTTPVALELHADKEYIITFRKEGCEDSIVALETHVQAGFVVLDILAGIIGVAVDAATGEWKEFNEKTPYVELDCSN